jgi:hypothetical protein
MKIIMLFLFCVTMLFAVKPVPHPGNKVESKDSKTAVEFVKNKDSDDDRNHDLKSDDQKQKDHFKDDNSDGVNDQREDDLQKIKNTQSKYKNLIKKKNSKTSSPGKKPATPKKIDKK